MTCLATRRFPAEPLVLDSHRTIDPIFVGPYEKVIPPPGRDSLVIRRDKRVADLEATSERNHIAQIRRPEVFRDTRVRPACLVIRRARLMSIRDPAVAAESNAPTGRGPPAG